MFLTVALQVEIQFKTSDHADIVYRESAKSPYLKALFDLPNGTRTSRLVLDGNDGKKVATIWGDAYNNLRTVEITLHWLCTVVVLRLFRNSLTISIAAPKDHRDVTSQHGVQLCRHGCAAEATGLVARYEWKGSRCHGRNGLLHENFPDAKKKLNVSTSLMAQFECENIVEKYGPSIFLSACRWDIAFRSWRPKEVRQQFACSAEFAAYDQDCLAKLTRAGWALQSKCRQENAAKKKKNKPPSQPDPDTTNLAEPTEQSQQQHATRSSASGVTENRLSRVYLGTYFIILLLVKGLT